MLNWPFLLLALVLKKMKLAKLDNDEKMCYNISVRVVNDKFILWLDKKIKLARLDNFKKMCYNYSVRVLEIKLFKSWQTWQFKKNVL